MLLTGVDENNFQWTELLVYTKIMNNPNDWNNIDY